MTGLGGGDGTSAGALAGVELVSIPGVGLGNDPVDAFFFVAPTAGVGDAEFTGKKGIRLEPTVVMPGGALHVVGGRHVTGHAGIAGAVGRVVGVRERINRDGAGTAGHHAPGRGVALHAEGVIGSR